MIPRAAPPGRREGGNDHAGDQKERSYRKTRNYQEQDFITGWRCGRQDGTGMMIFLSIKTEKILIR
jgi:hypothetical protein